MITLKTFRTGHAFYGEIIAGDELVGKVSLAVDPRNPTAFDGFRHEAHDVPAYDDFEIETSPDFPAFAIVAFFEFVGGKRSRIRSYVYGPAGYLGDTASCQPTK